MKYPDIKRILVARTDKIGDVILTLPVIANLRIAYPDAHIAFLAAEYARKVLEGNPNLNDIILYEPEGKHKGLGGLLELTKLLEENKFDVIVIVFPVFKVVFAAFLAQIAVRIGVGMR